MASGKNALVISGSGRLRCKAVWILCTKNQGRAKRWGTRLEPLEALLAYLFWCNPERYGEEPFTGQLLCDDLNANSSSSDIVFVQPSDLSLLRQGRPISEVKKTAIGRKLQGSANSEKRAVIARKLGVPELFSFGTQKELIAYFQQFFGRRLSGGVCEIERVSDVDTDCIGSEKRTVDEISRRLKHSKYPVLSWKHRFDCGAAQVLSKLGVADEIALGYDFIAHLWPGDLNHPFQAELLDLCVKFAEEGTLPTSPTQILSLMKAKRVLVVFHLFEVLELEDSGSSSALDLLRELLKETKKRDPDKPQELDLAEWPVVLLSGTRSFLDFFRTDKSLDLLKPNEEQISEKINNALLSQPRGADQHSSDLREALRALSEEPGLSDLEEAGPLLRRAELLLSDSRHVEAAPIHQRIRALAIARHDNCSSFLDPTTGFVDLVGGDFSDFQDVQLFHREVARYADYLWERDGRTETKATRSAKNRSSERSYKKVKKFPEAPHLETVLKVSTGLHWLSRNAFEALQNVKITSLEPEAVNRDVVPPVSANINWVHVENHEAGSATARYFCSLGAKAILQDSWAKNSKKTRCAAHFIIAEYLNSIEDDKSRLPEEYPYAPHWGRSRIHFLGEKIRFLIRALSDSDSKSKKTNQPLSSFPKLENLSSPQLDTSQVVNYCYTIVFRQELNGNRPNDQKRNLSKRHGAFRYAVELLALLSENGEVGKPHPALALESRSEFVRECGLALLDIGLTAQAGECFSRLEAIALEKLQAVSKDQDSREYDQALLERLDSLLISSLFYYSVGNHSKAWTKASLADELITDWHSSRGHMNKEDGGPDWRTFQRFQGRKRQVELRRAQKHYLDADEPDFGAVLDIFAKLEPRVLNRRAILQNDGNLRNLISKELPLSNMDFSRKSETSGPDDHGTDGREDRERLLPRRGPLDADMLHFKIAAFGRMHREADVGKGGLNSALRVCLQALLQASSDGMHHDAMGLRISLSGIYRRLGALDIAEAVMDEVHGDLLRFGASERTYLAFLAESGRILVHTDRQIHGYVTYLRPCIFRASQRGFLRDAARAARTAVPVLESKLELARAAEESESASSAWQNKIASALLDYAQLTRSASSFTDESRNARLGGPLFAYSVPDVQQRIIELSKLEFIEEELAFCRSYDVSRI